MHGAKRSIRAWARRLYWPAFVACLALAGGTDAAELATTQVVQVEELGGAVEVVLGAGRLDGVREDEEVTLLRQGEAIVHPLTGEVLGIPQEPVGVARIFALDERRARGALVKRYSQPQVDDLVEYEKAQPPASPTVPVRSEPPPPAVDEMMARIAKLERALAAYRRAGKAVQGYPVFVERAWNEIAAMKSYLISLDERLIILEEAQRAEGMSLTSRLEGEYGAGDLREFTIRYTPDTQIKLKIAGKTLLLSVEQGELRAEEVAEPEPEPGSQVEEEKEAVERSWWAFWRRGSEKEAAAPPGQMEVQGEESGAGEAPWEEPHWLWSAGLVSFALIAGGVYYVIKRRYREGVEGLEEFEEDYEDEDEEDYEDEDEEE